MSSVCAEQHKFFHPSHHLLSLKKSLRDIDIPPRKLLTRRATAVHDGAGDMFSDETLFQKYLPHNNPLDSSDDSDPYSSDHFRMFEFKVRRCTRSRSHDWTDCPFAHPGEKARRRDPRRFHYSGTVCPDYRRGSCSRGDACEFSHGVFECWLHPSRYRTEACKDGKNCKRKVCFFAHTPRELRVLPPDVSSCNGNINCNYNTIVNNKSKLLKCCYCHCSSSTCSPTSTLFNMSHFSSSSSSPPMSPSSPSCSSSPSSLSPTLSRFVETSSGGVNHYHDGVVRCKDVLNDVMCSLEGLNFGEASPVSASKSQNLPWLDVSLNCEDLKHSILSPSDASFGCEDHHNHHQKQFILSPTINSASFSNGKLLKEENKVIDDVTAAPDLGWVNDLLM